MRESFLDAATAAGFLARLGEHIDHNINIMDREGVIIASLDSSRVGSYHEAARRLVATGAAIERVDPEPMPPAGVRPGINLPIVFKSETIGVVGVTGDPAEVIALAYAVKSSVESMVELEAWKDKAYRRQGSKNLLQNLLLYDDDAPRSSMESQARKLGYDPGIQRVPIVFAPPKDSDPSDVLAAVKRSAAHGPQDMSFTTSDGAVLVFKSLPVRREGLITGFQSAIGAYVESARKAIKGAATYVGAFQTDLGQYREAFRQASWLAERYPDPGSEPVYLFNHMLEYVTHRVRRSELVAAFDATLGLFPPDMLRELGPSIDALAESALNSKEAAARLGIHRNTLSARMDRVTRLLGRDPRRDLELLEFLRLLLRYAELRAPGTESKRPPQ